MNREQLLASLRGAPVAERVITALDVADRGAALRLAAALGPRGRLVKVGLELFTAAGPAVVADLRAAGRDVFLDLKLKDIPNTVAGAVRAACALDVSLLTLHADGGRRMLQAAAEAARAGAAGGRRPALLAVTVLTSLGADELEETAPGGGTPAERVVRLARLAWEAGCDGVVCAPPDLRDLRAALGPEILAVTPGVRPAGAGGDDQRRVATPAAAFADGADYLVVGRPVTGAADPGAALHAITEELCRR
ncbi:MAG: orotidine-5'-phosphate decarboxylase [Candidatus Latescibacteria bacterium]|nr:orotidine-5'-phosphate decarboxylase [Candidatus Latescibacterota bacterium]